MDGRGNPLGRDVAFVVAYSLNSGSRIADPKSTETLRRSAGTFAVYCSWTNKPVCTR